MTTLLTAPITRLNSIEHEGPFSKGKPVKEQQKAVLVGGKGSRLAMVNSVDLVYLDGPFNSNRTYSAPIGSKAAGAAFLYLHCDPAARRSF